MRAKISPPILPDYQPETAALPIADASALKALAAALGRAAARQLWASAADPALPPTDADGPMKVVGHARR